VSKFVGIDDRHTKRGEIFGNVRLAYVKKTQMKHTKKRCPYNWWNSWLIQYIPLAIPPVKPIFHNFDVIGIVCKRNRKVKK
jgi:hypothetical protein